METNRVSPNTVCMQEIMKADIFFFITTIAVILLTVLVIVALYYVIRIVRNVRDITERMDEGSKALGEDLKELRTQVKSNGFTLRLFSALFRRAGEWISQSSPRKRTRAKGKDESADGQ